VLGTRRFSARPPFGNSVYTAVTGKLLSNQKSYGSPTDFFTTFQDIFTETKITYASGHATKKWLAGPTMNYWPQQPDFALRRAATGFGVS